MIKSLAFAFLLILTSLTTTAQTIGSTTGNYKKQGNTLTFLTTNSVVKLEFCSSEIFRVRASWNGKFEANEQLMVNTYNWPIVNAKVEDKKRPLLINYN